MADKTFPFNINKLNENVQTKLRNHFKGPMNGFVEVGSQKWIFPQEYTKLGPIYYNLQIRPDDIWIVTFPRSGTTLTQEIIWLIDNNYNFDEAKKETLFKRFPALESNIHFTSGILDKCIENAPDEGIKEYLNKMYNPAWKILSEDQGKRYIKTHIPIPLLPKNFISSGCKVIYVARNPKDVLVSNYHYSKTFTYLNYVGTFKEFWDYFKNNVITHCPYFEHIKEGWKRRNEKNVLFLFYEDINANKEEAIKTIAKFLGKSTPTESQMDMLKEHLSINNFKTNNAIFSTEYIMKTGLMNRGAGNFVRKGVSGGWRNEISDEINQEMDKWIEENLQDTDLQFKF